MSRSTPDHLSGAQLRALCRRGEWKGTTAGAARGFAQANLVVLPAEAVADFIDFCRAHPQPCPVLERLDPGVAVPRVFARDADVRTDLPRYRVFRSGVCVERPTSIGPFWRSDLVAFLIGCSFTFEAALLQAGLPVRHIEQNRNVPMYRTNIECRSTGRFSGPLVVSMRPMKPDEAERAKRITAAYPRVHGAPVGIDDAARLGITDLSRPDFGDPVTIRAGEVPVFWACGVTPIEAIRRAKPEIAITHEPGHMFVTDVLDRSLRDGASEPRA